MITVTKDPITLDDVSDLTHAPFLIEGNGNGPVKIYLESKATNRSTWTPRSTDAATPAA